jgi:hypothetical protein
VDHERGYKYRAHHDAGRVTTRSFYFIGALRARTACAGLSHHQSERPAGAYADGRFFTPTEADRVSLTWRFASGPPDVGLGMINGTMRLVTKTARFTGIAIFVLTLVGLSSAQSKQTFTGTITDSMCPKADHSQMQMGPSDAACTLACVDVHGAAYVLYDGKNTYELSDQRTPAKFAGQKVKVVGTLDAKTKKIQVQSIR